MAYAIERAAEALADPDILARARELSQSVASPSVVSWLSAGWTLKSEAEAIAAQIAARTGSNPLDIQDPYGPVSTYGTEHVNLAGDIASSAGETGNALSAGLDALSSGGKWIVVGLVAVAVIYVAREVRS
jgi:hypothetical protein